MVSDARCLRGTARSGERVNARDLAVPPLGLGAHGLTGVRLTAVDWALSAAPGFAASAAGAPANARPLTLSIGIGLLGEAIPIGVRLLKTAQQAGNRRRLPPGSV